MRYKIPIQIENEDTIVLGLSLRQLGIIMGFGGLGYAIYGSMVTDFWWLALIPAIFFAALGIIIALTKVSEMTFLPLMLNFLRMKLNGTNRPWSQWTDSFSPMEIGVIVEYSNNKTWQEQKESFDSVLNKNDDFAEKLKNL